MQTSLKIILNQQSCNNRYTRYTHQFQLHNKAHKHTYTKETDNKNAAKRREKATHFVIQNRKEKYEKHQKSLPEIRQYRES